MKLLQALILVIALAAAAPLPALADEEKRDIKQIVHYPPYPEEMPFPGSPMKLGGYFNDGDASEKRVRMFAVIDGQLLDIPLPTSELDDYDHVIYYATVHAPIAEMSYHFVSYSLDGTATVSPRFSAARACKPKMEFTKLHVDPNLSLTEKLQLSVEQLAGLDNDIRTYEEASRLLDEIQAYLKE